MKRFCKRVNIFDRELIIRAINRCLEKRATRKRHDTAGFFARVYGITKREAAGILADRCEPYSAIVSAVADLMARELRAGKIDLPPVSYRRRADRSNGKMRVISVLHIKELLYDHLAVEALQPLMRRVGEYQYAGLPGRGTTRGMEVMRRWVSKRGARYVLQLDIAHCYPSMDKSRIMAWLARHVKNEPLLRLIARLLNTCDEGIHIGSYLSQTICTLYLSELYHEIAERMYTTRTRRGVTQRINLVRHVFFYADDITLMGDNARNLREAARRATEYARERLGLTIKPRWREADLHSSEHQFADALGFRIYRRHVTIRRRVFRRCRRAAIRVAADIKRSGRTSLSRARLIMTYNGWIQHTDSKHFSAKYNWQQLAEVAAATISKLAQKQR